LAFELSDVVLCPQCLGTLSSSPGPLFRCSSCDQQFPPVGEVACLLPEQEQWRKLWRAQLAVVHQEADLTVSMFEAEGRKPGLLPTTRQRLEEQATLTRQIVGEVDDALRRAVGEPLAPSEQLPPFSPLESLHLLFRDWGWPASDENGRAFKMVERVLGAPLGRVLVLGAGACRLAYDLHVRHKARATVALDIDPLVLLTANRVLTGRTVKLTEGRSNATELTRLKAERSLEPPEGPTENFHLLLANGLQPPLQRHCFDTVLTPWFVDLVPPDLRDFVGMIHRLLVPGGQWINYGPLLYPLSRPGACRFSREELLELARRAGFELGKTTSELMPFSLSPLAERGRLEQCLAFCARAGIPPADVAGELPSWVVLPHLEVPDFEGRATFQHSSAAFRAIVELIDGKRSVNEIAAVLAVRLKTNPPGIRDSVRHCLLETHPACRAR
jgi:hypothetical protein